MVPVSRPLPGRQTGPNVTLGRCGRDDGVPTMSAQPTGGGSPPCPPDPPSSPAPPVWPPLWLSCPASPPAPRAADDEEPRLVGRAVLPVKTYAPGPPSGTLAADRRRERHHVPAAVAARRRVLRDRRGPASRASTSPCPTTASAPRPTSPGLPDPRLLDPARVQDGAGGSGAGERRTSTNFIQFSDPDGLIGFPIVSEATAERWLTGGDIDPESLQVDRHGDLWVGDEFGPWILHFDAEGRLLETPIPLPGDLMSPNNPHLSRSGAPPRSPTAAASRAWASTAGTCTRSWRAPRWPTCTPTSTRRLMFEYDTNTGRVHRTPVGRTGWTRDATSSPTSPRSTASGFVVIERDGVEPGRAAAGSTSSTCATSMRRGQPRRSTQVARPGRHPGPRPRVAAADPYGRHRPRQPVPGHVRVGRGDPGDRPGPGARRLRQQLPEHRAQPGLRRRQRVHRRRRAGSVRPTLIRREQRSVRSNRSDTAGCYGQLCRFQPRRASRVSSATLSEAGRSRPNCA